MKQVVQRNIYAKENLVKVKEVELREEHDKTILDPKTSEAQGTSLFTRVAFKS